MNWVKLKIWCLVSGYLQFQVVEAQIVILLLLMHTKYIQNVEVKKIIQLTQLHVKSSLTSIGQKVQQSTKNLLQLIKNINVQCDNLSYNFYQRPKNSQSIPMHSECTIVSAAQLSSALSSRYNTNWQIRIFLM